MKKLLIGLTIMLSFSSFAEKNFERPTLEFNLEGYEVRERDWDTQDLVYKLKKEGKSLKVEARINCLSDLDKVCTQLTGKESRANQNTLECEDTKGPFWKSMGFNVKSLREFMVEFYDGFKKSIKCPRYQQCVQSQVNPKFYFLIPTVKVSYDVSFSTAVDTPAVESFLQLKESKPIYVVSKIECE